ncbi:MAG: PQQ-dependent sugar dehydrogenase [Phycisphaerales bacterium JB039]
MSIRALALAATLALASLAGAQQTRIWVEGLQMPLDMAQDPTDPSRFYVAQQRGQIRIIEDGALLEQPFYEADPGNFTGPDSNWERGLLGLAFAPDYADSGHFYINYTGAGGTTHISRFTAASPHRAEPDSELIILTIDQPWGNHNGGNLRFGPDGMLWIGTGDGGSANDPRGAGQRLDTLLGKMLRIDPSADDFPDDPKRHYRIPQDNPFIDRDGALPEIWAYGLRNPWRYEFDSQGRLWIADVGQNRFEEIHLQPADSTGGENYGWAEMEGRGEFRPGRNRADDPPQLSDEEHRARGYEPPVWVYRHSPIASVTGGYLYEGQALPRLRDRYIFADFMTGQIWSFRLRNGRADDVVEHDAMQAGFGEAGSALAISSFARDADGELYILDLKSGRILKIVP